MSPARLAAKSSALRGRRAVFPPVFSLWACFLFAAAVLFVAATPAKAQHRAGASHVIPARHFKMPPPVVSAPVRRPAPTVRVIRRPAPGIAHRRFHARHPDARHNRQRFGDHPGQRRHRRYGALGPVVLDTQQVAAYNGPAIEPDDRLAYADPDYRYYPPRRCVAPKIIQIGPINREYGPGPRLIYGDRNRCGSPVFVNAYKNPRAKKAKSRRVRKY